MATNRQSLYLRDLGVDPRAELDDLPKEEASEWIEELKEYTARASLPVGRGLTAEVLRAVGAREDALMLPPSRSAAVRFRPVAIENATRSEGQCAQPALSPPADESWWKLELQATVPLGKDHVVTIAVSGSEHRRRGLGVQDAEALAERVRGVLEVEVRRVRENPAWVGRSS
jgi:hypothetical protein